MKNEDKWHPSKFVYRRGRLMASRDVAEVNASSRLAADLVAEWYNETLRQHAKGRLLDLGCGKAPLYHAYREFVSDIICVDWANSLHKNEHLDFECDLSEPLPFANGEFDTVILSDVLEHLPEPGHLWKEMARVLAPGGKILLNVPYFYWLHERPHDYYRYSEFALRRFVEQSSLRVISLRPIGGSPEIIADIFAKHFQFVPVIGSGLAGLVQYCTKLFIMTPIGKRLSAKTSEVFPFGYFLIAGKPYANG
ncbi:MAG: class I SAM-dependent methyltransferase [Candidatus Hydrogenedentales bacterium]